MYNKEWKDKYLQICVDAGNFSKTKELGSLFEDVSVYEERYGKDVCAMALEELQVVVDGALGNRTSVKEKEISLLRGYIKWCIASSYPDANDNISDVNLLGLAKMRAQTVANPLHFQLYLDSVFRPSVKETMDEVYKCYLWLGYLGVNDEDAMEIMDQDIDLIDREISYRGKEIPIYTEAMPVFKNVVRLQSFVYEHPEYEIRRDRVDGHLLLRGVRADVQIFTIRSAVSRGMKRAVNDGLVDQQITFRRARLSGIFYRMYERERAGLPVDFSTAVLDDLAAKGTLDTASNKLKKVKLSQYEADYERWKLVYHS